ncbi:MAG: NAD(P)H-binding protein [Rhodoferax sp.]|nr:NAD(P)H-binding protein [Rhodoferax sp.]
MAEAAEVAVDRVAERVVMVAGATGLVGREVLAALLADKSCTAVHSIGRKAPGLQHPKLTAHVVSFARLPRLPRIDEAYISLGTTIKVAGSQQAFREVDFDAVVAVARAARAAGATRLGLVSAMGADPASSVFYNRVKGEAEAALQTLGLRSLVIARPSMLAGDRASLGQEERLGERLGLLLMSAFKPVIPRNYRAIAARDVAQALITAVMQGTPGCQVLLSGAMQRT